MVASMKTICFATLAASFVGFGQSGGWISLFDGKTLSGWQVAARPEDRGKTFWKVQEGALTCDSRGRKDHHYVWLVSDKEYGDFELRVKIRGFRDSSGNSGVQVRSRYDKEAFWLDGPQVDVHPPAPWRTGLIYDETRGTQRWIFPSLADWKIDASHAPKGWSWKYAEEGDGWNDLHMVCRGANIATSLNGVPAANLEGEGILNDEAHRKRNVGMRGHLALQLHVGDELFIQYKDIRIRPLTGGPRAEIITFNDDGGWCWFEDERIAVQAGKLVIGSVAAGIHDPARKGDIEALSYDPATGKKTLATLHRSASPAEGGRWLDDHNSPAFLARPDGRMLAMYSRHGNEEKIYYRISAHPGDATAWQEEQVFVPSKTSRATYSNLHWLSRENGGKGRIYDFYRGLDNSFKPSYAYSEDLGQSWISGNVFIEVPSKFRHRPYVKYASNGTDTVHIAYTDGHPRNFDNSIYHIYYRNGKLHRSDGALIRTLAEGLRSPEEGARVFQGDPNNVAWISDLHLDRQGRPYLAYSVQKDSAGLPDGQAGEDHRYRYARWRGTRWADYEIAYAGSKLYAGEDDYTGNIALDPQDPNTVYISTNADPVTGQKQRHWEIFQGTTRDGGAKWTWTAVTRDSTADNIRPMVPIWDRSNRAVLWLRGKMWSYTNYDFEIVGILAKRP